MLARLDAPMCFVLVLLHVGFNHCLALFRLRNGNAGKAIPSPRTPFRRYIVLQTMQFSFQFPHFLNAFMFPGASKPLRCTIIFLLRKSNSSSFSWPKKPCFGQIWHLKIGNQSFSLSSSQIIFLYSGRFEVSSAAVYTLYRWYRLLLGVLGLSYPKCTSDSVNSGITQLRNLRKTTSTRA